MKAAVLVTLITALSASTADAANIMWRSPTAGVLEVSAAPPSTPDDDPAEPSNPVNGDFGIFYGSANVRAKSSLLLQPLSQTGFPGSGYAYTSGELPAGAVLDRSTGIISGKITAAGTYSISITIQRDGKADIVTATIVVG